MARDLASLTLAAGKAEVVRPVLLVRLDFASGVVRATSAPFDIRMNGETYLGVGTLGAVSGVAEGAELQGYAIELTLSGVPPEMVALTLQDAYQGRDAQLYLGLLNDAHQLAGSPVLLFRGRMDTLDLQLGTTATLTLTVQSRLSDWERPRLLRYTHEQQQADYPDDKGFEFIAQMAEKTIVWGRV
jgi:hypothetical protein